MGLCDGAGEWLVIRVDDHPLSFDVMLELLDCGGNGQELPVEGGVPGLGVGESTAEEGVARASLDGVDGGLRRWRCRRRRL